MKKLFLLTLGLGLLNGCTVISYDRVFPKLTWAWTDEAKYQRAQDKEWKAEREGRVPSASDQQERARKLGQAMFDDTHPK